MLKSKNIISTLNILFSDELDAQSEELMNNNSCTYTNEEPNVVGFYNDMEITENVDFPPGAVIVSRLVGSGFTNGATCCGDT